MDKLTKNVSELENMQMFSNLTEDMLIRGNTPPDIEKQCLSLCQAFVGGRWINANVENIKVTRITGGLTNQLYRVQLDDHVKKFSNSIYDLEPNDLAVKLFQSKFMKLESSERLSDNIILTAISELDIGPKVYGIFSSGTIQEYTEHEHFRPKHQQDPKLMYEVANLLVKLHNLEMPICKNNSWPIFEIEEKLNNGYAQEFTDKHINELNLNELKSQDLRDEFSILKQILTQVKSPIVFSHNDYIGTNILVTKQNQKLVIIDFEYSSYFSRAWDIAVFHAQWGIEPFDYDNLMLPNDSILKNFIKNYIECFEKHNPGYSKNPKNNINEILKEVKLYTLLYLMYIMSAMLSTKESIIGAIPFDRKTNLVCIELKFNFF